MSTQNVAVIRGMIEAFNESGDRNALYSRCDPDVVFEIASQEGRESPDFRVYHGLDEARGALEELMRPFGAVRAEVSEYIDAGGDRVVAVMELLMRPKDSAAEVSTNQFAYLYTLRDGKIVRIQDFPEPADALEAAGLTT
jgi:ketosteroid isomerase-like protein